MNDTSFQTKPKHIILCRCGGERIDHGFISDLSGFLEDQPVKITILSDLCGLVATKKEEVASLVNNDSDLLVIGCHKRTMDLLFGQISGEDANVPGFRHINLIEAEKDSVFSTIREYCKDYQGDASSQEIKEDSGWPSWYPIIDYSRCTSCMQCADFCLFGVYGKSDGRVDVINPQGCKNNCPACARICPSTAIIFPKYRNGGAVGGSDLFDENAEHQRQAMDINEFLGSDIYSALEKRKIKRQSIIRNEAMKKAIDERDNALNEG